MIQNSKFSVHKSSSIGQRPHSLQDALSKAAFTQQPHVAAAVTEMRGPQSPKYLPSGPLQKTWVNSCSKGWYLLKNIFPEVNNM